MKSANKLDGRELDFWMARALGYSIVREEETVTTETGWMIYDKGTFLGMIPETQHTALQMFSPSTIWSQGGPLVEKYICHLDVHADHWLALNSRSQPSYIGTGDTLLIAACRCIVATAYQGMIHDEQLSLTFR